MTIDDLISKFGGMVNGYNTILKEEMETIAEDGLVLVDRRITREGKNAQGSPFADYTPGYKKQKQEKGRYRGMVDLTLSGEMWKNIGITNSGPSDKGYTVTLGGKDKFTRDKMEGNNKARPGWFTLSDQEQDILRNDSAERMQGRINDLFDGAGNS